MTEVRIAAIVEGHGECEAVPILIRRIALEIDPGFVPNVLQPLRVPATKSLKREIHNLLSDLRKPMMD